MSLRRIGILLALSCCAAAAAPPPPDPLLTQAAEAVKSIKLKEFTATVEREMNPLLAETKKPDLEGITRLASLHQFSRYFVRIEQPTVEQAELLFWLLNQPRLLQTLMMALSEQDGAPDVMLNLLKELRAAERDRLNEFPDLATALCVVWDLPGAQKNGVLTVDPQAQGVSARVQQLFRYYANTRGLRFEPRELPWQLAVYLVDNLASSEEIAWASQRYAKRGPIGATFFDVPYDYGRYAGVNDPRMKDRPYTLPNLVQFGGICGDQAYFAVHVARAVGAPAAICVGHGAIEGTGHAWVGFLDMRGGRAEWNFSEGRYAENQYWKGRVQDPQTRQYVTDADVSLLAELQNTSSTDRLASDALCKLSDRVDPSRRAALLMRAINLAPGNGRAWLGLAELSGTGTLSDGQFVEFRAAIDKFAIKRYPDFAWRVLWKSIASRGTAQQIALLEELRKPFSARPDLVAQVKLAQGDVYREGQQPREALKAYGDVLEQYVNVGPIVLEATRRVDSLLHETSDLPRLAAIYQLVWARMPQPQASIAVQGTPYYRVGEQYRQLLSDLGQTEAMKTVQARLDSVTSSVSGPRR